MECPCKNCISFAICKSKVQTHFHISSVLGNRCSLFNEYINSEYTENTKVHIRNIIWSLYGKWDTTKNRRMPYEIPM